MLVSPLRRRLLAAALGAFASSVIHRSAWAAGSDTPEKKEVRIGFIPLTDCASVIMASLKGYDLKHGIKIVPSKESSWASIRDKLSNGELDYAHALYGLVYGMHVGLASSQRDMAVLMTLSQNGQGITLAKQLLDHSVRDGVSLKTHMGKAQREFTFAQTFPTGTHALWLYYWLAAHDIHPLRDARILTVPPPQMVANMRIGTMDGFCAGEPWNARAVIDKVGFTVANSQDIWPDHPEKVLASTDTFVDQHPNTSRAVIAAVLEASRWIDTSDANRRETAHAIAERAYLNTRPEFIEGRMVGEYDNGAGRRWKDKYPMRFFNDGAVNFPWLSDGAWFLTQQRRWGLLKRDVDYLGTARKVNRIDLYKQGAAQAKVSLPSRDSRVSVLMDGRPWDVNDAVRYANSFAVKAVV